MPIPVVLSLHVVRPVHLHPLYTAMSGVHLRAYVLLSREVRQKKQVFQGKIASWRVKLPTEKIPGGFSTQTQNIGRPYRF